MYNTNDWKGIFLNDLVKKFNFNSYLELGIAQGETWNNVKCNFKEGVDSNLNVLIDNIVISTTDDYFKNLNKNKKFDLVFIDACHEKHHVKNDFFNSFKHLNNDGIVVFHDINSWSRQGAEPYSSHGDCYEFWINLVDNYDEYTSTFEGHERDYVGLFFKKNLKKIDESLFGNMKYGYDYHEDNREKYLFSKLIEI